MKRLLLVMLVVFVLIGLAALVGVRADDVEPVSRQDAVLAQLAEGCDVYDLAPAPSPPASLASRLVGIESITGHADTMESPPTRYDIISAEVREFQMPPPYELRKESAVQYSDRISVRDHAPC